MGQISLRTIAIINIQKSSGIHILQESMDRIIDIIEKRKNREFKTLELSV